MLAEVLVLVEQSNDVKSILNACACAFAGLFVALISEGHVYVVEPGDTVSLECNFHADQYDLFEYPVLWRKRQHIEDSQVNVMGTLMEPFSQRNRFEVAFDAFDSRYRLMLHIYGRFVDPQPNYPLSIGILTIDLKVDNYSSQDLQAVA